jgi:hypothetical protein
MMFERLEDQGPSQAKLKGSLFFLTFLLALLREGWFRLTFFEVFY